MGSLSDCSGSVFMKPECSSPQGGLFFINHDSRTQCRVPVDHRKKEKRYLNGQLCDGELTEKWLHFQHFQGLISCIFLINFFPSRNVYFWVISKFHCFNKLAFVCGLYEALAMFVYLFNAASFACDCLAYAWLANDLLTCASLTNASLAQGWLDYHCLTYISMHY